MADNILYYGDNLEILRRYIEDGSVDLVYLRPATHSQNQYNKSKTSKKTSSCFVGMYLEKCSGLWAVYLSKEGKSIWIGRFKTQEEAARAYDRAALKYHGQYARLNFPREDYIDEPGLEP